ncbi:7-cyano-7-deazaguanine synthase QueC [bacterium]|nr:7-cyano-7-deazaguanine synthase QueC [bacterium]
MKKALVLYSGGIDSTTALYWALHQYEHVSAITVDYNQRHRVEIPLSQKTIQKLNIPQKILKVDLKQIGGSSLTDKQIPLPEFEVSSEIEETPSTYVPFRNGILLSLTAAWAEKEGIKEIVCGFNVIDSPHYPDTTLPFVQAMEKAINQGTKASSEREPMKIRAPFVNMKKSEIIKKGLSLGADYSYSISCYRGKEIPCQKCSSCLLRQKAWQELGLKDPLIQRLEKEGKL